MYATNVLITKQTHCQCNMSDSCMYKIVRRIIENGHARVFVPYNVKFNFIACLVSVS